MTHRMRSSGSSIAREVRSTVNQLVTSVAFGQASRTAVQVADVVVIVVGQEDPADVGRVDDGERGLHPLVPGQLVAGVDDHRLGTGDDHRVERDVRAGRSGHELGDHEGVGRHAVRGVDADWRGEQGDVYIGCPFAWV